MAPRCDGSRSLASLGAEDLRADNEALASAMAISGSKAFSTQPGQRHCSASGDFLRLPITGFGLAVLPSSDLRASESRAHCRCAAALSALSNYGKSKRQLTVIATHGASQIFFEVFTWIVLFILLTKSRAQISWNSNNKTARINLHAAIPNPRLRIFSVFICLSFSLPLRLNFRLCFTRVF